MKAHHLTIMLAILAALTWIALASAGCSNQAQVQATALAQAQATGIAIAQATATAQTQATLTAEAQAKATAETLATATAAAQATEAAQAQATAAAVAQATTTAIAQITALANAQATGMAIAQATATAQMQATATSLAQASATAQAAAAVAAATQAAKPAGTPQPTATQPLQPATVDDILGINVTEVSPSEIKVTVNYSYKGSMGDEAYLAIEATGEIPGAYTPWGYTKVRKGIGTATVQVVCVPQLGCVRGKTNTLWVKLIALGKGWQDDFYHEMFAYNKQWN